MQSNYLPPEEFKKAFLALLEADEKTYQDLRNDPEAMFRSFGFEMENFPAEIREAFSRKAAFSGHPCAFCAACALCTICGEADALSGVAGLEGLFGLF